MGYHTRSQECITLDIPYLNTKPGKTAFTCYVPHRWNKCYTINAPVFFNMSVLSLCNVLILLSFSFCSFVSNLSCVCVVFMIVGFTLFYTFCYMTCLVVYLQSTVVNDSVALNRFPQ